MCVCGVALRCVVRVDGGWRIDEVDGVGDKAGKGGQGVWVGAFKRPRGGRASDVLLLGIMYVSDTHAQYRWDG